jgi:hypothetical protein
LNNIIFNLVSADDLGDWMRILWRGKKAIIKEEGHLGGVEREELFKPYRN